MVVCDIHPVTLMEGAGFRDLLNFRYGVPSATHISEIARRKFYNGKLAIKDYLQAKVDFFAIFGPAGPMMHIFHLPATLSPATGTCLPVFW